MLSKKELQEKALSLLPNSPIQFSGDSKIEYTFILDREKILFFMEYLPKWKNGIRYFLISEIRFGVRERIGLYLSEESGELCVF